MNKKVLVGLIGLTILLAYSVSNVIAASPSTVLTSISGNYSIVWAYNASSGSWLRYVPGGATNTLTDMNVRDGYWIKMTAADTLELSGTDPGSTSVSVYTGWNLVGYPSTTTGVSPTTALASISGNYSIVWAYNASSGSWLRYVPGGATNTLTSMLPGYGYWVKMTADDTLIYT